jgi:hypothetical protein
MGQPNDKIITKQAHMDEGGSSFMRKRDPSWPPHQMFGKSLNYFTILHAIQSFAIKSDLSDLSKTNLKA